MRKDCWKKLSCDFLRQYALKIWYFFRAISNFSRNPVLNSCWNLHEYNVKKDFIWNFTSWHFYYHVVRSISLLLQKHWNQLETLKSRQKLSLEMRIFLLTLLFQIVFTELELSIKLSQTQTEPSRNTPILPDLLVYSFWRFTYDFLRVENIVLSSYGDLIISFSYTTNLMLYCGRCPPF